MLKNLTFRKKLIFSQIALFILFVIALFPLIDKMASTLVRDSLIESTSDLKDLLKKASSEKDAIDILKKQQYYSFFRMSLINDEGLVIYDTHLDHLLGEEFKPYKASEHEEVQDALQGKKGYLIAVSDTFGGKFAYVAEQFRIQGTPFVLRTAFPFDQIEDLTETFELGVLIFSFIVLLFFNLLIWFIFARLTRPIREIIRAITPYQQGETPELPEIALSSISAPNDDFSRLASTFNSLSKRIHDQIETLKEEKDEKEAILESLGEGVIAVDGKMNVLYINYIACKLLGLLRKDLLEKPFGGLGAKVNQELMSRCKDLLLRCQEESAILTDALSFGIEKKTYIDLIAAPKAHGTGAIIVLQDKTHHYRVLEMGKDFVANASHELRTPITIIKGFTETLSDMPDMSKEMRTEIIEKISRNCARMESLAKSLLTLADIENLPESRFHPTDLVGLLDSCRHTVRAVYPDAEITIDTPAERLIIGADASLLELALINLLDNAAKYSTPPAKITVTLSNLSEDEFRLTIADQGQGIPAEDIDHIFDRFYRVDKTHSRRLGGAGLGLSLVKTIIHKHDGTIEASSHLGEGTTFTITLPYRHHSHL